MPRFAWTLTASLAALGYQTATTENDVFVSSRSHGIYQHDSARMLVLQNLVANVTGSAVYLNLGNPNRKFNGAHPQQLHRVYGNLLAELESCVTFPTDTSRSDFNVLAGLSKPQGKPFEVQGKGRSTRAEWAALGNDGESFGQPKEDFP